MAIASACPIIISDEMKKIKLDHLLAQQILTGGKRNIWYVSERDNLAVNDQIILVDKVNRHDSRGWKDIGTATIEQVTQKRLADVSDKDIKEYAVHGSREEILQEYQQNFGPEVTWQTPVKILHFAFTRSLPQTKDYEELPRVENIVIYADGGSRGNPGPSASGYIILDDDNNVLLQRGVYLGITTNNQAEYTALKLALEEAKRMGAKKVDVYMDSLLVVNQMKGIYKVRNRDLWPIHDAIKQLTTHFKHIAFTHVPRELNKLADAAVNQALDEKLDIRVASKK